MFETSTLATGIARSRRRATLKAENAYLRKLLSERPNAEGIFMKGESRTAPAAREDDTTASCRDRLAAIEDVNAQLRASEEFNRRILDTTTDSICVLDLDGNLISMNEAALSVFTGGMLAQVIGRPFVECWQTPESHTAVGTALESARNGRTCRFQAALENARNEILWWDVVAMPMNGGDGQPERILTVARDITELKQTEARQDVLMREMAHRMKNTFAMVQAVATQTLRNARSLEDASDAINARLLALSHAHDVLMQGAWSSVSLRSLVDTAVDLHSDGEPGRFVVNGPDITLGPRPGLTLALILHELGTNAAKYGALSRPEGHVAIDWSLGGEEGDARLRFRWQETDGPPVKPPTRAGFGTRLIERSLVHGFGGTAKLQFPESGVVLIMEAPAANVGVAPIGT